MNDSGWLHESLTGGASKTTRQCPAAVTAGKATRTRATPSSQISPVLGPSKGLHPSVVLRPGSPIPIQSIPKHLTTKTPSLEIHGFIFPQAFLGQEMPAL